MLFIYSRKFVFPVFCALLISLIPLLGFTQSSINEGIQLFEEGNISEAKTFFASYVKSNKKNPQANFYMGRILFAEENFDDATDWFENAAKYDNINSTYYMWLGHTYGRRTQRANRLKQPFLAKDSKSNYEKAIELDPNNIEARESAMEFYLQAPGFLGGGRDKAEAQADAISTLNEVAGFRAWGRIYTYFDELEPSFNNYLTAIELYPEEMEFYFMLFNYHFAAQDFESASEIAKKQLTYNDTTAVIYLNLGNALQRMDEFDEAITAYNTALELDPTLYNVWYQFGRLSAVSGTNTDLGEEYLIKFIGLGDNIDSVTLAWAYFRLGTIYENKNALEAAKDQYELALKKDKNHEEANLALARLN